MVPNLRANPLDATTGAAKMTPEDKQLLLDAARAIGHPDPRISEGEWLETRYGLTCGIAFPNCGYWNPLEDDGDCARMCINLMIAINPQSESVIAHFDQTAHCLAFCEDHNNDRLAAWRYACTRVAAEIGRAKT
jgi:hypothetical protein